MTSTFNTPNANLISLLALTFILMGLFACEDPGSVGDQFSDQQSEIVQDTLIPDSLGTVNTTTISGGRVFSTAGIYDDQLFGRHKAIALIQPGIGNIPVDTLADDIRVTTMSLQLIIDQDNIWGDTLATPDYELVEIAERWDEDDWRYEDTPALTSNIVGEFSHQQGDTVEVSLDSDWVKRYVEIFNMEPEMRDSTFAQEIFGFAVVPKSSGKLLPINIGDTRLHINTTTTANELNQIINQSATSLVRDQAPVFNGNNFELSSTLKNSVFIDVDSVLNNLRSPALSAAILAIKQNDSLLSSTLPPNHIRPSLNETRMFLSSSENVEDILLDGFQLGTVIPVSPTSSRLELSITNNLQSLLIDQDSTVNMYLVYGPGNGLLRSSIYYGAKANKLPPTIFLTSLKP